VGTVLRKSRNAGCRLEENIGAAEIELTGDDLGDIERAAARITVQGARYPEQLEKMSNR